MREERDTSEQTHGGSDGEPISRDPIIGSLKRLYDDVASEPLPDELIDLLDRLDRAEQNR